MRKKKPVRENIALRSCFHKWQHHNHMQGKLIDGVSTLQKYASNQKWPSKYLYVSVYFRQKQNSFIRFYGEILYWRQRLLFEMNKKIFFFSKQKHFFLQKIVHLKNSDLCRGPWKQSIVNEYTLIFLKKDAIFFSSAKL